MTLRKISCSLLAVCSLFLFGLTPAMSDNYPSKPITLINGDTLVQMGACDVVECFNGVRAGRTLPRPRCGSLVDRRCHSGDQRCPTQNLSERILAVLASRRSAAEGRHRLVLAKSPGVMAGLPPLGSVSIPV